MSVWKSDEKLLSICILNFSFKNDFVWEEISNIRHRWNTDETPRSSSKIHRCAWYFQLSSRCFIWWWNTASHVWYITSNTGKRWTTSYTQECCYGFQLISSPSRHIKSFFRNPQKVSLLPGPTQSFPPYSHHKKSTWREISIYAGISVWMVRGLWAKVWQLNFLASFQSNSPPTGLEHCSSW